MDMGRADRVPLARAGVAGSVIACIAVPALTMTAGCASGGPRGLATVDVTCVRLEPCFSGQGDDPMDPVADPDWEWGEYRSELTITCSVKLPRG